MVSNLKFHFLMKTQCLDDGAAYFFAHANENPNFGQDGNFPYAGEGQKLMAKVAKHGRHRFRVSIEFSSTDAALVKKRLDEILAQTDGHPLSLNMSKAEMSALNAENNQGIPKHEDHIAAMREAKMGNQNLKGHVRPKLKWIHNPDTNEEMQLEVGEDLLTGFHFGRLKKKNRPNGPKQSTVDITKLSDAERAKLPEFMIKALEKQARNK
jgi:hypothetical protein